MVHDYNYFFFENNDKLYSILKFNNTVYGLVEAFIINYLLTRTH